MFNDADHLNCYRRTESIVPQQALALSNSKLAIEMAEAIAGKIENAEFVDIAFEWLLGRRPGAAEREACVVSLVELEEAARAVNKANPAQRARRGLVHALLNHNDFVSIR